MAKKNKNRGGFTLIEVLVVVLIIGILSSIALPQYQKSVVKARIAEAKILVNTLYYSLERYKTEHLAYPAIPGGCHSPDVFEAYLDVSIPPLKHNFSMCYYQHAYVGINYTLPSGYEINIARDWRQQGIDELAGFYCEYWEGHSGVAALRNACASVCGHNNFESFGDAIGCRMD